MLRNSTVYNIYSFPPFLSLLTSSLTKFSMELMEPVSSVASLEKLVAPGLWLRAKEKFFRQQLMPRPSLAALLSFILEGIQVHPFRLSEYCKKQVWTSPRQLCRTLIGKQIMYKLVQAPRWLWMIGRVGDSKVADYISRCWLELISWISLTMLHRLHTSLWIELIKELTQCLCD